MKNFKLNFKLGQLIYFPTWSRVINNQYKDSVLDHIHVTSFSSILYYSNVRLISKLELELNQIRFHLNKHYLETTFEVVHKLNKGCTIFQTEAHEPYPELNGRQIRRARGMSVPNHYIYVIDPTRVTNSKHLKPIFGDQSLISAEINLQKKSIAPEFAIEKWQPK